MQPEVRKLLYDALGIELFMKDRTLEDFQNDLMFRLATEREFEIIGEALNRLMKVDRDLAETFTEHRRIISFRNVLIHGYDF